MATKMLSCFLVIALGCAAGAATPAAVDLKDRLATYEFVKGSYDVMFGRQELRRADSLRKALDVKKGLFEEGPKRSALELIKRLDAILPEKILIPVTYWKVVEPNNVNLSRVLSYAMLYRLLALRDVIDDPLSSDQQSSQALMELRQITGDREINSSNIFGRTMATQMIPNRARSIVNQIDIQAFAQAVLSEPLLTKAGADYSLSALGFIPGNQVQLVSENDRSEQRVHWFNDRFIFNGGQLDWSKPYMNIKSHIVFQQDPIYIKIRDMIDSAKDSIFIDIFLFGGTLGAVLAKHLLDRTIEKQKSNPKFRTLILHDFATNYNMKPEMMPVFEYIRDRINGKIVVSGEQTVPKGSVLLLQANIQRHPPGVPFGLSNLIEKSAASFKAIEQMNTYYESKIDHSKVIVVDANTDNAQAYFGSKNWTDHSGGYYYDNAIYVKGPAASLVQACYYDDVEAALTTDKAERAWFFFKEQGFGNDHYLSVREDILSWMKLKRVNVKGVGSETVRLTEANVDGRIKDTRNMLIDMISRAESHIYMEQLFIYDKYVMDALIKRKLQKPNLDVRILADHNGNFGMNGLPNTIFMRELMDNGIQIRARRTQDIHVVYPDGSKGEYHQENHRKITSVDGKVLLGGSSNLNPDTLQGSFREFGAQIFAESEIANFETQFLKDWSDESQTMDLDIQNLKLKVGGRELSTKLSRLVNDIAAQLIRVKDELEKR